MVSTGYTVKAPFRFLTQFWLSLAVLACLWISVIVTHNPFGMLILPAGALGLYIVWNPGASILTFMAMNVVLATKLQQDGKNGVGAIDLIFGLLFVLISVTWFLRIRVAEWQEISAERPILFIIVFYLWCIIITAASIALPYHDPTDAIRELLNLLPLVILPVLYSRYIEPESKEESHIFVLFVIGAAFLMLWNLYSMKQHIAKAIYLYQTGRSAADSGLALLLGLLAASHLMLHRKSWQAKMWSVMLILALAGALVSGFRTIYVCFVLGVLIVFLLGSWPERKQSLVQWLKVLLLLAAGIAPLLHRFRVLQLLAISYLTRLLSTQRLGRDPSLAQRFLEWRYLWIAIKESPILGHGFGAHFRLYNMLEKITCWISFSHSSYLYLIYKTGFFGAILFLGVYLTFVYRGLRLSRSKLLSPQRKAIVRGGTAFLIAFMLNWYTEPDLASKTDLVWVGLLWGFFLVTENLVARTELLPGFSNELEMLVTSDGLSPA